MRSKFFLAVLCYVLVATASVFAADQLIISEFAAENEGAIKDEDGDKSDWIEIHNAGTNTVNLLNWSLTDSAANLTKWTFPSTNIPPNGYLLVFASNKDRHNAGRELHTNFKLDTDGEYLALVRPDGTVAFAYAPKYPLQAPYISYGIPLQQTVTTLLATGAAARVLIPSNSLLGETWSATNFNDSSWLVLPTGIGYEADGQGAFVPVAIADSYLEFSGVQGSNNWYYGYWDKKNDVNGVYSDFDFLPFPNANTAYGPSNYWNGTAWDWFNGDPPFTQITATGALANANNGNATRADHWAIRRYISEVAGPIKITGKIVHTNSTDWVYVTQTGVSANSLLYLYLTGVGDGYIDDLKLVAGSVPEVGANLLPNGDFESPLTGPWTVSANHSASAIVTDVKHGGTASLHMVASVGGTTQASAIWQTITPGLNVGDTYTLSYWFKPGSVYSPLVVRFSGNWINTLPALCGDGVVGRIFVDGAPVYSQVVNGANIDYSITVPVNFGSRVDFALDPRADDLCENAVFTAHIETGDPGNLVVADSLADWSLSGTQGEKNWYYGYYNRTADTVTPGYQPGDFTPFPHNNVAPSAANFWTGDRFRWFNGDPPFDQIGQAVMKPNGVNSPAGGIGNEHWVIRRWVSTVSGSITVDWKLAKLIGLGSGVTGRIFYNGVQQDTATIGAADEVGVNRSVSITNVHVGDFIDIALDPTGTDAAINDTWDDSLMSAVIRGRPTLTESIGSNVQAAMRNVNATAYIRIPFVVTNSSAINFLTLRMKYDDGFIATINGVHVTSRNSPESITWNSAASTSRFDAEVNQWEEIDITPFINLLHDGTNLLAIQGMNAYAADSDFLILPELRAITGIPGTTPAYFLSPTPGAPNGAASTNLGPVIANVTHVPNVPQDNEDLYVTAAVRPTFYSISNVQLVYRIMFGSEVTVPMLDDGLHADGLAGDGVYGAIIPASASTPGQMVRYYIYATDVRSNAMRLPTYLNTVASPQYFGTIVYVAQPNGLPLLHLFIPDATLNSAGGNSAVRYPVSVFYLGEFYDNCGINRHGQSSAGFPKKSYDLEFNKDFHFRWKDGEDRVSDVNLLTTYPDKAHIRNFIGYYGTYQPSGSPYHWVEHVRIQTNGGFFGDWHMMENGNSDFLGRLGLDPNGALYKVYQDFTALAHTTISIDVNAEKKSRKTDPTGNADLVALFNGVSPTVNTTPAGRATYMYDNINVPEVVNTMTARVLTGDVDCCHKNYYFYRDSDGTGEWSAMPWDIDLSFGRNWASATTYWQDEMFPNNGLFVGNNNPFFSLVMGSGSASVAASGFPQSQQMYLRRLRTLLDEIMQPTNTPPSELKYEKMIAELSAKFMADATLDLLKWGSWGHGVASIPITDASYLTVTQGITQLLNYLPTRRDALMHAKTAGSATLIPPSQPTNVFIGIGTIEYNPSSANQAQEYIQLVNNNNISVDMSFWKISGAVDFTLPAGCVIVSNSVLYVSPDVKAFRARATSPKGGERNLVVGPYKGQLSARGESLLLTDTRGRLVVSNSYMGTPSGPQQYLRITEIMYHPAAPGSGSLYPREDYEYIELKNIGPGAINLGGVHFTNGIEFVFGFASNLGPGVSVILAKNPAAFASRYPAVTNVVGPYGGNLNNAGDSIRLDDAVGEKILDFSFNNSWYPMTDGNGFSLVIVNENALWTTWDLKESWRPSGVMNGTPNVTGINEPPTLTFAPIVVNEVLTHTDFPSVDAIELHNPTTNSVDIGGWWISDDFFTPLKYRVPAPRVIAAGGYTVFTESDFNASTGPTNFSFSSQGDEAYIFSGNGSGQLSGYFQGYHFGAAGNGVSFGRYTNSQGEIHFVAQSSNTFNFRNARPKVGPVVISEIMYHPSDIVSGTNVLDNTLDEFVELHNLTTTNVPLYDPAFPTNRWKLDNAVEFSFSTNTVVASNGYLVVVSFDPVTNAPALAAFRLKYGVPANIPIAGPYSGKLDNSDETVELYRPDAPETNAVPFVLVDAVHYSDLAPWDFAADGFGLSLQRRVKADYGNDPTNWFAALPNAGAPSSSGQAPTISQQPRAVTIVQGRNTNMSVTVTGTAPLAYQWQRNGLNLLNETNATLGFTNIQLSQTGLYSVVVYNVAGAAFSSNALVTVFPLPVISQQPISQNVQPGTNVTVSVAVSGTPPISYQWRFNGTNILNATNSSYSFTGADLFTHSGYYDVLVQDFVAPLLSQAATIIVLVRPVITNQPVAQSVVQGGTAVFSLVAGPNHPLLPLTFRWIRGGTPYLTSSVPWLVLTNVQASASIRVALTNLSTGLGGFNSSTIQMTVLPDFDGDGIADEWELRYGMNTNNAADGLLDLDGDGMNNHDEFIAGTDPYDASSLLKLIRTATNKTVLQFLAQTNISYTVQYRTNLTTGIWTTWTNILPQQSQVRTIEVNTPNPPPESVRFYRIITPILP